MKRFEKPCDCESVRLFKRCYVAHLKMCHMLDTLLWTCCTLKILLRVQPDYIYYWFYFDNLTNQIREKFVRLMFWYNLQTWSSKFGLRPICHRPDSMYLTVIRRRADFPELLPAAAGCWQEMGGGPSWPARLPPEQESKQKSFAYIQNSDILASFLNW